MKRYKPILLSTVTNYKEEKHEESSVVSVRRRIIKKIINYLKRRPT